MDAAQVKHQGILTKRGRMIKSWLQRWFVLTPSKLLYFESKPGSMPNDHARLLKGTLPLKGANVVLVSSTVYGREHCFQVATADRNLALQARNREEVQQWMSAIKEVIDTLNGKPPAAAPAAAAASLPTPAASAAAAPAPAAAPVPEPEPESEATFAPEEQKAPEETAAAAESDNESEDDTLAVDANKADAPVEEVKAEEPVTEPEPQPEPEPEPTPAPAPAPAPAPVVEEAKVEEQERDSEDSEMNDLFRPSLSPAVEVEDTSSPAYVGMTILKKTTKEAKYRARFCWIDHEAKSVHWSKQENREPPNKELFLRSVSAVRKGSPQRIPLFGSISELQELGLTLATAHGEGIDLKFKTVADRDEWHAILTKLKSSL